MKPYTLTNREGESISPMTSTKTVFDEHGTDLDTLLSQQRQDADNALKGYAKKAEVTQGLNGKQDRLTPTTDLHITDDNIIGLTEEFKNSKLDKAVWDEKNQQFSILNEYINVTNGITYNTADYFTTPFIAINHNYDIIAKVRGTTNNASAIALYDQTGKFIVAINQRLPTNILDAEMEMDSTNIWALFRVPAQSIPENATYFRCGSRLAGTDASYSNGPTFESREGAFSEAIAASKLALFIDMWNEACGSFGRYNSQTGYFELNGLTDITYEEAVRIYSLYFEPLTRLDEVHHSFQNVSNARTFIPYSNIGETSFLTTNYFDLTGFEVVRMSKRRNMGFVSPSVSNLFGRNPNIRAWLDEVLWFGNTTYNNNKATFSFSTFDWYSNHPFEYFRFKNVNFNIQCVYFPNIGIDSFQYLVDNRFPLTTTGANPITITVHPNIYAKLTGDTSNAAAAELTEEELAQWQQLLVDAAEKQIIFATT